MKKSNRAARLAELDELLLSITEDTPDSKVIALLDEIESLERPRIGRGISRRHPGFVRGVLVAVAIIMLLSVVALAALPRLFGISKQEGAFVVGGTIPPSGQTSLSAPVEGGYLTLSAALTDVGLPDIAPTWIPERYALSWLRIEPVGSYVGCSAWYQCSEDPESGISVRITQYSDPGAVIERFEAQEEDGEYQAINGVDVYISSNSGGKLRATWGIESYLCTISGAVTANELTLILESIKN